MSALVFLGVALAADPPSGPLLRVESPSRYHFQLVTPSAYALDVFVDGNSTGRAHRQSFERRALRPESTAWVTFAEDAYAARQEHLLSHWSGSLGAPLANLMLLDSAGVLEMVATLQPELLRAALRGEGLEALVEAAEARSLWADFLGAKLVIAAQDGYQAQCVDAVQVWNAQAIANGQPERSALEECGPASARIDRPNPYLGAFAPIAIYAEASASDDQVSPRAWFTLKGLTLGTPLSDAFAPSGLSFGLRAATPLTQERSLSLMRTHRLVRLYGQVAWERMDWSLTADDLALSGELFADGVATPITEPGDVSLRVQQVSAGVYGEWLLVPHLAVDLGVGVQAWRGRGEVWLEPEGDATGRRQPDNPGGALVRYAWPAVGGGLQRQAAELAYGEARVLFFLGANRWATHRTGMEDAVGGLVVKAYALDLPALAESPLRDGDGAAVAGTDGLTPVVSASLELGFTLR